MIKRRFIKQEVNTSTFNEIVGDMWTLTGYDAICITTNGYVGSNGAVLGTGCALEASLTDPMLSSILGNSLTKSGNKVFLLKRYWRKHRIKDYNPALISFPIKPQYGKKGDKVVTHKQYIYGEICKKDGFVSGWAIQAQKKIIKRSCKELMCLIDKHKLDKVLLPSAGCGAGELHWDTIKPIFNKYLDNRITVITKN